MPAGETAVKMPSDSPPLVTLPRRVVLTGFMGAGKSTVGMRLADELGWQFIDLDQEIVRAEQKSIAEIFEADGESHFRKSEHRALLAVVGRDSVVLALGGGAVETAANLHLVTGDPETLLLYLEAPIETLIARCEEQHRCQHDAPRRPVLEKQTELLARFARRKPLYEQAHWTISTGDGNPEDVVQKILAKLKESSERQS